MQTELITLNKVIMGEQTVTIKIFKCISIATLVLSTQIAVADESKNQDKWHVSTTLGLVSTPNYVGDDENQLLLLPDVRVSYGERFFASFYEGVGYNAFFNDNWKAGPIVKYDFGRDEDGDNALKISSDDTKDLIGLGNIDGSAEAGAYLEYTANRLKSKLEVRQGLSGGHEGLIAEAELKLTGKLQLLEKPTYYAIGPEVVYGDTDYNQSFFGISSVQSTRTGLKTYQADSGLVSYGLHASAVMPLNEKLSVISFAGYDALGDTASDSPLIRQRGSDDNFSAGLMMNYKF